MNKYLINELWGGIFKDPFQFTAKTKADAIKQYLKTKDNKFKAVFNSGKNYISNMTIVAQEGHIDESGRSWIRGKRHFYFLVKK